MLANPCVYRSMSQTIINLPFRFMRYNAVTKRLDPPYLSAKPPIPIYTEIQFDLKCFDFAILEQYVKYLRKFFTKLNLEVEKLKAIHLPVIMDVLYQNLPEGVELTVGKTDPNADEARYVPQLEVQALQEELSKLSK
ncbi:unnamed protein product [Echinostoma caproni]|uniref:Ribosomal_S10 domain-containing protein n=1 Tax=Echinostoma caproni TaxID=27848 RepID=A0A183A012_9TREM|nr:unnamed protein product [Echinostoma caproni]